MTVNSVFLAQAPLPTDVKERELSHLPNIFKLFLGASIGLAAVKWKGQLSSWKQWSAIQGGLFAALVASGALVIYRSRTSRYIYFSDRQHAWEGALSKKLLPRELESWKQARNFESHWVLHVKLEKNDFEKKVSRAWLEGIQADPSRMMDRKDALAEAKGLTNPTKIKEKLWSV